MTHVRRNDGDDRHGTQAVNLGPISRPRFCPGSRAPPGLGAPRLVPPALGSGRRPPPRPRAPPPRAPLLGRAPAVAELQDRQALQLQLRLLPLPAPPPPAAPRHRRGAAAPAPAPAGPAGHPTAPPRPATGAISIFRGIFVTETRRNRHVTLFVSVRNGKVSSPSPRLSLM